MAQQTTTTVIEDAWRQLQQDRPNEALQLIAKVLAVDPANVSALACRAMAQWEVMGDNPQSIADMAKAVETAPDVSALRHNFGNLLSQSGRVEEAAAQYREALRLKSDDAMAFWGLAQNSRMSEGPLVDAMERLYRDPAVPASTREFLAYGLAKVFDDIGVPEKAITYAMEGNRLIGRPWSPALMEATVAELRKRADADAFRKAKRSGHPSRAPVFIVGMPRSGTTLIETILSRHPAVLPLGESKQIARASAEAARFTAPGAIDFGERLGRDWLKAQAETIARGWARRSSSFSLVTDKMPDNALALGLIGQLFPNARIIYARRHPLDVGVSAFLMRFSQAHGFTTRLDWIGLRSRYLAEMMEIWRRATDLPILDVHYERLVSDPEPEIRRLVAFVGLDWTDDFLTPEQSERSVRTASQWQVRQPIYQTSVARWKRYEPWLGPMIEAMGGFGWIEAQTAGIEG